MKNCGAYIIFNAITGDCYIGSTNRLVNRFNEHRSLLNRGKHANKRLQELWSRMDGVGFCFSVVEYCDEDARIGVEQKYMDMYKPSLNIAPNAGSLLGMKASEETKQKISVSHKGERNYWYGRGKEMPNYGKPLSEAQKELLSKMRKGDGNPMYGVTPPHAKMTPDQVREVRAMLADGMRLTEIAKIYGVSTGQISHIKQGRSYKGVV